MNFATVKSIKIPEGVVKTLSINSQVVWRKKSTKSNRFRFKNVSGAPNTLKMVKYGSEVPVIALEKSNNGVDYEPFDIYVGVEMQPGETLYLRGKNKRFSKSTSMWNASGSKFTSTGNVECHGSIMDLIDNATDTLNIPQGVDSWYTFGNLFSGMTTLLTVPDLPAVQLINGCYYGLFSDCTGIIEAPYVFRRGTTYSYAYMFSGCTNLVKPPTEISVNYPGNYAHEYMFNRCTSLTETPKIIINSTDSAGALHYMFSGCRNLKVINLENSAWSTGAAEGWVSGVAKEGVFNLSGDVEVWNGEGTKPDYAIPANSSSGIPTGWTINRVKSSKAFGFKNVSDQPNTIKLTKVGNAPTVELTKSTDGLNFEPFDVYAGVTLQPNEIVYLKGVGNLRYAEGYDNYNNFSSTDKIECFGGISFLHGVPIAMNSNVYTGLFKDMIHLLTIPEIDNASEKLAFYNTFSGCTSLTEIPDLSFWGVGNQSCDNMFSNCNSLKKSPNIYIGEVGVSGLSFMFGGCRGITKTGDIYVYNRLSPHGCEGMFSDCKSLMRTGKLIFNNLADNCCDHMFSGCVNMRQAPMLPNTVLAESCYRSMFHNCLSLKRAPHLPATDLVTNCYSNMFAYAYGINHVSVNAKALGSEYSDRWLYLVSDTGNMDAPNLTFTNTEISSSGIPVGWTLNGQPKPENGEVPLEKDDVLV